MQTLKQNNTTTVTLYKGQALKVSADALSSGQAWAYDGSAGGQAIDSREISAGETEVVGPSTGPLRIVIQCRTGSLSYDIVDQVLIVSLTQAQYDAIPVKNPGVLYVIPGA